MHKRFRLTHRTQFDAVFRESRKMAIPGFLLFARPNGLVTPRLGFVFSKKNLRHACLRNRVKRIFRESFRQQASVPVDVVALAKTPMHIVENASLRLNLEKVWKKLNTCYAPL